MNRKIAHRILDRCDQLSRISASNQGIFRAYLMPEHRLAAQRISKWMQEAGMHSRMDEVGNVVGRIEGKEPNLPAVLLGSHFDTVCNAGRYDGILGILTAIESVAWLSKKNQELPFALEVIAFADEEGARFSVPFIGSRAVTGQLSTTDFDQTDDKHISLGEALIAFSLKPELVYMARRSHEDIAAYLELHIEQGPRLEHEGISVGVVDGIQGQTFGECHIFGKAGHAGTVPMQLRCDALSASAESILAIEAIAKNHKEVVATVGRIDAKPGSANVIPGKVSFSIDLRAPEDHNRKKVFNEICAAIRSIAKRRQNQVEIKINMDHNAMVCDPHLNSIITESCKTAAGRAFAISSGAGHDAQIMASICPVGMIFVRCKGGISHHPDESVNVDDVACGYQALTTTILSMRVSKRYHSN